MNRVFLWRLTDIEISSDSALKLLITPYKTLRQETSTMNINKVMRSIASHIESNSSITSHSFRIASIVNLWRNTSDIE